LAGGTESMSEFPYTFTGNRANKPLRSLDVLKKNWATLLQQQGVALVDSIEEGLTDPVKKINMAGTAEGCGQIYGVSREAQDKYAVSSLQRCLAAWNRGFYNTHVVPFVHAGQTILEKDEYPFLREDLAANPERMAKAPLAFENSAYTMKDFYNEYGAYI